MALKYALCSSAFVEGALCTIRFRSLLLFEMMICLRLLIPCVYSSLYEFYLMFCCGVNEGIIFEIQILNFETEGWSLVILKQMHALPS